MRALLPILALTMWLVAPVQAAQTADAEKSGCAVNIQGNNNTVRCKGDPLIPCSDLTNVDYDERYDDLMNTLIAAGNRGEGYNRYDVDAMHDICEGHDALLKDLIDYGYVKATDVAAMKRILVRDDRSELGKRLEQARRRIYDDLNMCVACAANMAEYYVKAPNSQCARMTDRAFNGDQRALQELSDYPDYCAWWK